MIALNSGYVGKDTLGWLELVVGVEIMQVLNVGICSP